MLQPHTRYASQASILQINQCRGSFAGFVQITHLKMCRDAILRRGGSIKRYVHMTEQLLGSTFAVQTS
jgi:hypothetical protein